MRPIETAESFYYPVPDLSVAERPLALHWTRRDKAPFRPQGVSSKAIAYAEVNHGRWIVRCPFCASAQFASKVDHRFFCVECLNETVGRRWVRVTWPADVDAIEVALLKRAGEQTRNWLPGEAVGDLERQNVERGVI